MPHSWLYVSKQDLEAERLHLSDEGYDLADLESEFQKISELDLDVEMSFQSRVQNLLDLAENLPQVAGYSYREPDQLEAIKIERPDGPRKFGQLFSEDLLFDHLYGAWLGRCCGCLLGKPVEGWRSATMWPYLKELNAYPLNDYFRSDVSESVMQKYKISPDYAYVDRVPHMVEDDDINYTVTNLAIYKQHGSHFSPSDVASFWMNNIPILHTCTAERVAYRNFCLLFSPPRSARFRNPYREWIGAQIRADFWGYVAVGNPELAADFAWRDACISHVRNGIYGEMWVAAMLASAPILKDPLQLIKVGLSEIPKNSRFADDIQQIVEWYLASIDYEQVVAKVHQQWDENKAHHWTHTNSNAQIVAIGLLWGEKDFERSICRAVQACFDTDCNGATVGSILGMILGAKALPHKWISVLNDTLASAVAGYTLVKISDLARETCHLALSLGSKSIQ